MLANDYAGIIPPEVPRISAGRARALIVAAAVRQLAGELSPAQQAICRALMNGDTLYGFARRSGRHYETIRRRFRVIQQIFADRGVTL